jgi:Zn-dependent peptidase ImmA (M78 family)
VTALNLADLLARDRSDVEVADAAREYARRLRAEVLHRQGVLFERSSRMGLGDLKALAEAQGVRSFEFDAPIASEGELVPLATGGFLIRVTRSASTNRGHFTVAHEIGHTLFYDSSLVPPRRLDERPQRSLRAPSARALLNREEAFCDEFASELLLPTDETRPTLEQFSRISNGRDFIRCLERIAAAQAVSVRMLLVRLDELGALPKDLVTVVLMVRPHAKTGSEEALRVVTHHCTNRRWFVPANQRATTIGFTGALELVSWWEEFPERDTSRKYRRSGVASFRGDSAGGARRISSNDREPPAAIDEDLLLWRRGSNSSGRWRHVSTRLPVLYRFYASGVVESYCLAVIDVPPLREP